MIPEVARVSEAHPGRFIRKLHVLPGVAAGLARAG